MWDFSTLSFTREGPKYSHPSSTETLSDEELLKRYESVKSLKKSLFAAIVVSWNDSRVTILCPFCKKTHNHGIDHFARDPKTGTSIQDDRGRYTYDGSSPTRCHARVSHCDRDNELWDIAVSYSIIFPFEEDSRVSWLSFEVDKGLEIFRTVGFGVMPPIGASSCYRTETSEECDLRNAIQEMSLRDGDYDVVTKFENDGVEDQITQRASVWIASFTATGDLDSLKQYLDRSPDSSSLLSIKSYGTPLLGLAVPDGHFEVVKYLLESGCDVNSADRKGRTPLMEAALWGRPKIANFLLEAGANKLLKDRYGMNAHDFAGESDRNDEERHTRGSNYTEDPYIKKRHRSFIRALLGHDPAPYAPGVVLSRESNFRDAHFYKSQSAGTISLVLPTQGVNIYTQAKTAAVLLRGGAFPPVVAVSGWNGLHTQEFLTPEAGLERLNEAYWALETLKVASDIGVKFEKHSRDKPGFPGIYNACHAEAQLMSLFVRRNYVFRDYEEGQSDVKDDFLQLFMLQPRNRTAKILISKRPCESCKSFRDYIDRRLGIKLVLQELSVKT